VVSVAITMRWCARGIRRSLPRVTVLLAGIAVLPTQSGSISLLPARLQLSAIERLPRGPQLQATEPLLNGNFVPPAGGLQPSLTFNFSWSVAGLPEAQGSDPAVTALLNGTISASSDEFGVGSGGAIGAAPTVTTATSGGIQVVCEQLVQQLQAGGNYWNTQAISGPPAQFAVNSPADPTRGPSGDPPNLSRRGPAGAWCRPPPVPFADSSPLAGRAFWTPIAVVLLGVAVFWLSRGVRLPP
jgi:hypothetical protein